MKISGTSGIYEIIYYNDSHLQSFGKGKKAMAKICNSY